MTASARPAPRIVITGASSGIGAATAIAFAARGARLVLGARGQAGLADTARRAGEAGGTAEVRTVDVNVAAAVRAFAEAAREALGGIDLWFSCVGVGVLGRYEDVPMADHARVITANLVGHMNEAHALLPVFLAQEHGVWVNMISVGGYVPTPWAAAYSASKFGLRGFSQALRGELSKRPRIHVCDVYPTFVDTPAVGHAGNYTGKALTLPPGSLAPDTVAKAVVCLLDRPRDTTVVGMPSVALKLGQMLVPNLGSAVLSGFFDTWAGKGDPAPNTAGSLFEPPAAPSGPDGMHRDPGLRRKAAIAGGAAGAVALAGVAAFLLARQRRG